MSQPPRTTTETAADHLVVKARELAGRARRLPTEPPAEWTLVLAMIAESARGVAFWMGQLKKALAR